MSTKTDRVKAALVTLFKLTNAEVIEIHSGDREPGMYLKREQYVKPPKAVRHD